MEVQRLPVQNAVHRSGARLCQERMVAGHQLVEDDSEGEEIRPMIDRVSQQGLR